MLTTAVHSAPEKRTLSLRKAASVILLCTAILASLFIGLAAKRAGGSQYTTGGGGSPGKAAADRHGASSTIRKTVSANTFVASRNGPTVTGTLTRTGEKGPASSRNTSNPLQPRRDHVFQHLSPTYEEMLIDFEEAERRWKQAADAALPTTADGIAARYGIPRTVSPVCPTANNATSARTRVGWIPCTQHCGEDQAQSGMIPRYIFQTWKSSDLSAGMCSTATSWSEVNSEYDYFLFDDNAADEMIRSELGDRIFDSYKCLSVGAAIADFWRLVVLYLYGGIYMDADLAPLHDQPFRSWNFGNRSVITGRACGEVWWLSGGCSNQMAMIYAPRHPVIRDAIVRSLDNLSRRTAETPYDVSFWSYHLAWAESPYNQSYMPGWKNTMGGRVVAAKSKEEMNKQSGAHWSQKIGRNKMWKPECLANAPKNFTKIYIPPVCDPKTMSHHDAIFYVSACSQYCARRACNRPKRKVGGTVRVGVKVTPVSV